MIEMDDDGCDAKFKLLFDFIQQSKFEGAMTLGIMTISIKGLFAT
jgi:hypothetical protein